MTTENEFFSEKGISPVTTESEPFSQKGISPVTTENEPSSQEGSITAPSTNKSERTSRARKQGQRSTYGQDVRKLRILNFILNNYLIIFLCRTLR